MPLGWSRLASSFPRRFSASAHPLPLERGGVGLGTASCSPSDRRRPGVAPLSAINRAVVGLDVVVWFSAGQTAMPIELQALNPLLWAVGGGPRRSLALSFLLTNRPQALACAFDPRSSAICCPRARIRPRLGGHRGGAHRLTPHPGCPRKRLAIRASSAGRRTGGCWVTGTLQQPRRWCD